MAYSFLIVDDDEAIRVLVGRYLKRHFPEAVVVPAANVEECVQALTGSCFSLVVSDAYLRPGTWMDVLKLVNTHAPGTPVIVLTGWMDQVLQEEVRAMGAGAVVPKRALLTDELRLEIAARL